jgi:hypothetical protein
MTGIALGLGLGAALGVGRTATRDGISVRIVESRPGAIAVATLPGATCQALVGLPWGPNRPHRIGEAVVADARGSVLWTYTASTPGVRGTISHTVTCSYRGASALARADVELGQTSD